MDKFLADMSFDVNCDCGNSFTVDGIALTTNIACPKCNVDIPVPEDIKQDHLTLAKHFKSLS